MKLRWIIVTAALVLSACAGGNRAHLDLVMEPGPGADIDTVTAEYTHNRDAVDPETVATVDFDGRTIRVVRYTALASGDTCIAAIDGESAPTEWCADFMGSGYFATVELLADEFRPVSGEAMLIAPEGTAVAQVWTVFGYVVSVEPLDDLAYFAWNPDWGRVSAIRLLDDAGEVIGMRSL